MALLLPKELFPSLVKQYPQLDERIFLKLMVVEKDKPAEQLPSVSQ